MKKIYTFFLALCLSLTSYAQLATITSTADSICEGQSVTLTANVPTIELNGATGTNNQNGIMFDITATNPAVIVDFAINNLSAVTNIIVYYRTGSHVGFENSAAGWIPLDTAIGVAVANDVPLGLNLNQNIVAGQTLAFYISTMTAGTNISYGNGTSVGTVISSNSWISIKEGVGKAYPFGASFTPRTFIGRVFMRPAITSTAWSTGANTPTVTLSPTRSIMVDATISASANTTFFARKHIGVKTINVSATATPTLIQPGQNSTVSATVNMSQGVFTTLEGGNSQNGAMFDVVASQPLNITGFTINLEGSAASNIEVLYKTGTLVGFETNAAAWTSIGTFTNIPIGSGRYLELPSALSLVAGQTIAFYITSTNGQNVVYSNGTSLGAVAAAGFGLQVLIGKGVAYPFGLNFSPRVLNSIVHYNVNNPTGITYSWSGGGSSATVNVTPNSTTTYTITVNKDGCSAQASTTVTVSGIGIDENKLSGITIYPNPANDFIYIQKTDLIGVLDATLYDLNGRIILSKQEQSNDDTIILDVSNLASGMYLLTLQNGSQLAHYKVQVL